jgi:GNAT superfamily N-acetyltransferase
MNFQEKQTANDEHEFKILESKCIIGTALVKKIHDREGYFWHLDDLQIRKESRHKGYGKALANHLITYLLAIEKLRIRVHPAIGQQVMESLNEAMQNLSEEELDERDRQLEQEMQDPDFWEKQELKQEVFNSENLKEWYRKIGFNTDDPDGKHLWYLPDSAT